MATDPRSIVSKADIAVQNLIDDGGYLNTIQANTFLRMVQEQPTLTNQVRFVGMNAPSMEINKIGFGSRILKAAPTAGTALSAANRSAPSTEQITLTTKKVIAEVHIPYDVLEDNIERGSLEDTIMAQITERISLDLEELMLLADSASGDAFLALHNGVIKLAQSHVVDYTGTSDNITKAIFKAGLRTMPNKYLRNRSALRFFVSPNVEIEYADYLANRTTILGDTRIESNYAGLMSPFGIPMQALALMPDSTYIFTNPKNIILGVQRDVMIESDRDIRTQVLIIVVTMRVAIQYEEEDAVVKCIGLAPDAISTTT